jgi:hypothetical protein
MTEANILSIDAPVIRENGTGYTYRDQDIDGFSDDLGLPEAARERIARFAAALTPEELSSTQKELLQRTSGPSALLRELAADEAELDEAWEQGLYELLTPKQLALLRDPSLHPKLGSRRYPLAIGDVAKISGASARQLHYWEQTGLLRAFRDDGGSRLYLRGAVVRAMVYTGAPKHVLATLTSILKDGPHRFARLLAAALLSSKDSDEVADAAHAFLEALGGEAAVADHETAGHDTVGIVRGRRKVTARRATVSRRRSTARKRSTTGTRARPTAKQTRASSTAKRSTAKGTSTAKRAKGTSTAKRSTAKRSTAKRSTAKRSTAKRTRVTTARSRSTMRGAKKTRRR